VSDVLAEVRLNPLNNKERIDCGAEEELFRRAGQQAAGEGLLAGLAQHERELISDQTKAALRAKKARGCVLGSPQNLTREATLKAAEARRRRALEDPANRRATELALLYRNCGLSYKAIAGKLNSNGHVTRRGKSFSACTIQRLLGRAAEYSF
jgi:DNA invertase Pin-like site-specific DNA recombinase